MIGKLKLETLIVLTLALSLVAIAMHQAFPRVETVTSENLAWEFGANSDQAIGGDSMAKLEYTDQCLALKYNVQTTSENPFAAVTLTPLTGDAENPRDLLGRRAPWVKASSLRNFDWFTSVAITARVVGKLSENYRFQFRTHLPEFSDNAIDKYRQYCEAPVRFTSDLTTVTVPRERFSVPVWWIEQINGDVNNHSRPNYKHLEWIEIMTGSTASEGPATLIIESIVFRGYWIPPMLFSASILSLWLMLGSCVFVSWTRRLMKANHKLRHQATVLKEKSDVDHLTGLRNRRSLSENFDGYRSNLESGQLLAFVLFDIDHFKALNDSKGHLHGDEVLRMVGNITLEESVANQGVAVRWGGEEFLLVAGASSRDQLLSLAERLRARIETETEITCSFGIHLLPNSESLVEAIKYSDKALYHAKDSGRNCITYCGPDGELTICRDPAEFESADGPMYLRKLPKSSSSDRTRQTSIEVVEADVDESECYRGNTPMPLDQAWQQNLNASNTPNSIE